MGKSSLDINKFIDSQALSQDRLEFLLAFFTKQETIVGALTSVRMVKPLIFNMKMELHPRLLGCQEVPEHVLVQVSVMMKLTMVAIIIKAIQSLKVSLLLLKFRDG